MQQHILAFNRALSQARSLVRSVRHEVATLSAKRKVINHIGKQLSLCMDHDIDDMSISIHGNSVYYYVNLNSLESFKCLRLETMLTMLENIGKCTRTRDYADYLNRDYFYDVDGNTVIVGAYVKSDSPTCRKVVVGSETVTNIKYELRCD
jgi:hypothetical protein